VPARPLPELSLSEWAVLAAVAEGETHGFAVARSLSPDGVFGRVWAVPRPVVYRALARLTELELVEERGSAPGTAGPRRMLVRATRAGRAAARRWATTPVEHVRDMRSHLLLKLAVLDRDGRDRLPLVRAQRDQLAPVVAGLRDHATGSPGFDAVLARWRYEAAQAAVRFLDGLLEEAD
jgi:PadR family transcriptional regulator AphA